MSSRPTWARARTLVAAVACTCAAAPSIAFAEESIAPSAAPANSRITYFVGVNVLSPVPAFVSVPVKTFTSVLSNLETGFGVNGGLVLDDHHALELRLALGPNSRTEMIFNTELYYSFFVMRRFGLPLRNLYVGAGLRYWDLDNSLTDVQRHNVAGALALGYRFDLGAVYLDLRAHEILGVYTWLSDENSVSGGSTVADAGMPVVPLFSLDFGVKLPW